MSQKLCARYTLGARYLYFKRNVEVWGARYTLGARYRSENTVIYFCLGKSFWHLISLDIW